MFTLIARGHDRVVELRERPLRLLPGIGRLAHLLLAPDCLRVRVPALLVEVVNQPLDHVRNFVEAASRRGFQDRLKGANERMH